MTVDYARMTRLFTRAGELGSDPATKSLVRSVYADRAKAPMDEFLAADAAMATHESAVNKEVREANAALLRLEQPYREARAVVLAYHPGTSLPETLKVQPTDTDRKTAIERLLDVIDDHAGEGWADELLTGAFGQGAGTVLQELNEAIVASTALSEARDRRAKASGLAYERFLALKNVVRNSYGAKSPQYRRIHLRADGTAGDEPAVVVAPAAGGTTPGG